MEKNVLSEINQMKYLFGYKAGKVISEQIKSKDSKEEMDFFTDGGITYKLPGITNFAKKEKFVRDAKFEETADMFGVSQDLVQKLRKELGAVKGDSKKMRQVAYGSPVWNLNKGVNSLMNDIAELGITPEKLTDYGIKNVLKQKPSWTLISIALDPKYGDAVMTEEQFFRKLGELIQKRMDEIKS